MSFILFQTPQGVPLPVRPEAVTHVEPNGVSSILHFVSGATALVAEKWDQVIPKLCHGEA